MLYIARKPPPRAATKVARAEIRIRSPITFSPSTLVDAAPLRLIALSARPVVDLRILTMNSATTKNIPSTRYANVRSLRAHPGGLIGTPLPPLRNLLLVKTKVSTSKPKARVVKATYSSPNLIVSIPRSAPIGVTMSAATSTASRTGQPASVESCAATIAPSPAKLIRQSQRNPPSPTASVNDKNMSPYTKPPAINVSQYPLNTTGRMATTASMTSEPTPRNESMREEAASACVP